MADKISLNPTGYNFLYDGDEAKALFDALADVGAQPDQLEGRTEYRVASVEVKTSINTVDDASPCFERTAYVVIVKDENQGGKEVEVAEDCNGTKARAVGKALEAMGGSDMYECALGGRCAFTAHDVYVNSDPGRPGKDRYTASGQVGGI